MARNLREVPAASDPPQPAQLPLFESFRPERFVLSLGGNLELALFDPADAALAAAMRLGRTFHVKLTDVDDADVAVEFQARVTKRQHSRIRKGEEVHIISGARLALMADPDD